MFTLVIVESPFSPTGGKKPEGSCKCWVEFRDPLRDPPCDFCMVFLPWEAELQKNIDYARACMADCLKRGEAPFASHLLYTQPGVLDDTVPDERKLGIEAGWAWRSASAKSVVYTDRGTTIGMKMGIEAAGKMGHPIEYRTLPGWEK